MRCLVNGLVFALDPVSLEWLYPDGSRTGVRGATVQQARRAMMFLAGSLARGWKAGQ